MATISKVKNIFKAYGREQRLLARKESGYDPENGIYVNLRNDGEVVRIGVPPVKISTDADFWRDMDIRRNAERVQYMRTEKDRLPARFGTVLESQELRPTYERECEIAIFGSTRLAEIYKSCRAWSPRTPRVESNCKTNWYAEIVDIYGDLTD